MAISGRSSRQRLSPQPRVCAAMMGMLVKGLGADHVVWGTDAVWTGSPQWQIEGLRRLEIPEDMQKRYGFAPLGAADGPVKTAIFSGNTARIYKFEQHAALTPADRFAELKQQDEAAGPARSNMRYGVRAAVRVTQEALYGNTMILDPLSAE